MKAIVFGLSAVLCATALSAAETEVGISAKSPNALAERLAQMGYAAKPSKSDSGSPVLTIQTGDIQTAIAFGGCEKELNCTYIALVTTFTDVKSPPEAWLQKMNADYDLVKVSLNEDKTVRVSQGAIIEGLPVSSFRTLLDQWVAGASAVARDAVQEKLTS